MDMAADVEVIDLAAGAHRRGGQWWQCRRGEILPRLGGGPAPWDGGGHRVVHQDPAYRELCKRGAGRDEEAKGLDGSHGGVERETREGLADVERLARPVEGPVVVGREPGVGPDASGEQPARERHAGDDGDVARAGGAEELVRRALAEAIQ